MSKKDYKRGIKEGRRRAAQDVANFSDSITILNRGTSASLEYLYAMVLLDDAEQAALGNLNYKLNKTKTGWKV